MISKRIITSLQILLLVGVAAGPVQAGNEAMLELLKALRDNGTIDADTFALIRNTTLATQEQQNQASTAAPQADVKEQVKAEVSAATADLPKINTKGKLEIASRDGDFKWRLGGRIMADAAWYDNDGTDFASGTEFRRARLYASGTMWKVWDFKLQYDFAGPDDGTDPTVDGLRDAYVRYKGFKPLAITVGNFKEPFSLEELASSKYMMFMERSLANGLSIGRNFGVGFNTHGETWTLAAGLFGEGVDQDATPASEGYGVTSRVTFSPVHEKTRAIHLGAAVSWRTPDDDDSVRFRVRPGTHVDGGRLVDTGAIDADDYFRYGLEAAYMHGPFAIQGEYMGVDVNAADPSGRDEDFSAYYLAAGWFVTGESRNYKFTSGAFDSISPRSALGYGGLGAFELAVRYSSIDLSSGDVQLAGRGGEEQNLTFGLNWYPNKNLRFMANYVQVLDVDGGSNDGAELRVFQLRAQTHW